MSVLVQIGTIEDQILYKGTIQAYGGGTVPEGFVVYDGPITTDPDDDTIVLMVWDPTILPPPGNIRVMDATERANYERNKKIKELTNEAIKRARLVYGDNGFDELHFKLLIDIDNTYNRPGSTANRITKVTDIGIVWIDTINNVLNLMTDWELIKAYNVVNSPNWPV